LADWGIRERLNSTGPLSRAVYALQSLYSSHCALRPSTESIEELKVGVVLRTLNAGLAGAVSRRDVLTASLVY
jgi:hypothetical protein